jgi:transposase
MLGINAGMGAPSKLDDLVAQRIVAAVEVGAPWYMAAAAGGIAPSTLREWKQRARDGEEPYAAFLARLQKAEAAGAVAMLDVIQNAAREGTWQAAAWTLERRYPKQFALRRPEPQPLTVTAEEADALIAQAAKVHAAK